MPLIHYVSILDFISHYTVSSIAISFLGSCMNRKSWIFSLIFISYRNWDYVIGIVRMAHVAALQVAWLSEMVLQCGVSSDPSANQGFSFGHLNITSCGKLAMYLV